LFYLAATPATNKHPQAVATVGAFAERV